MEMMVNELFCYVSDYLPEEMDAFKRSAQEIYSPNWNCNEFQKEGKEVKGVQEESNKRHHRSKKKRYHISRPVRVVAPDMERHPRRREFTFDEKKEFVTRVQEAVKRGEKIGLVCEQLGICDRSYQRWKKAIEEGKEIQ